MLLEPGQEMLPGEQPLPPACTGLRSRDVQVKPSRHHGFPRDTLFLVNFSQGKKLSR